VKEDDYIYGFTENYIKVRVPANNSYENEILPVKITKAESYNYTEGEVL